MKPRSVASKTQTSAAPPPPVGRLLRAHRRGQTRARGRPDRGPLPPRRERRRRRPGGRGFARRARRGERRERPRTSDGTHPREGRARRGVERFRLHRRRREWTRPLGAPAPRRARGVGPPRRPSRRPTRRARFEAKAATTPPSARARAARARGRHAAADVRPRPSGPAQWTVDGSVLASAPPSASQFPALVDSFTQAFRVLQSSAAALIRAHAERGGDAPALGARRRRRGAPTDCSYADPASLLALLDADQATAARAILGTAARRRDGARGSSFTENADRSERNAPNGTLGDALANRDPDVASPRAQTPPSAPSAPER